MPDRNFTDEDLAALIKHAQQESHSTCRFSRIDPDELEESVKFYKNLNQFFEEGRHVIWKVLLVGIVGTTGAVLVLGLITKIKEVTGP